MIPPWHNQLVILLPIEQLADKASNAAHKINKCGDKKEIREETTDGMFHAWAVCVQEPIICHDQGCAYEEITPEAIEKWIVESNVERAELQRIGLTNGRVSNIGISLEQAHGNYGVGL